MEIIKFFELMLLYIPEVIAVSAAVAAVVPTTALGKLGAVINYLGLNLLRAKNKES